MGFSLAAAIGLTWGCQESDRAPFAASVSPGDEDEDRADGGQRDQGDLARGGEGDGDGDDPPAAQVLQWALPDDPPRLSAGENHTCALRRDGSIDCWGADRSGRSTPPDGEFVQLSCGDAHCCALDPEGNLECWGDGTPSGGGTLDQGVVPEDLSFKEVAAGAAHTCAITTDDDVVCWGAGDAEDPNGSKPHLGQSIAPTGKFHGIAAGGAHSCAISNDDGRVTCWGSGTLLGSCDSLSYECGQANPPDRAFDQISAGLFHSCGITSGGELVCWGAGTTSGNCDPGVTAVDGLVAIECGQSVNPAPDDSYLMVEVGWDHSCAINERYEAVCFGWNHEGQSSAPGDREFHQVTAGKKHSCGIERSGALTCWGAPDGNWPTDFPGDE